MRIRDRLYYYGIELVRVIDGDTIECHLDRGHNHWEHNVDVRLANINAPEMRGVSKLEGEEAKQFLIELLGDKPLFIRTKKTDNFERYIGRLYVEEEDHDIDVAEVMVVNEQAVPYRIEITL